MPTLAVAVTGWRTAAGAHGSARLAGQFRFQYIPGGSDDSHSAAPPTGLPTLTCPNGAQSFLPRVVPHIAFVVACKRHNSLRAF